LFIFLIFVILLFTVDRSRLEARRREHRGVASQREITVYIEKVRLIFLRIFLFFIYEALPASGKLLFS
jgi:hypothetical protein